MQKLKVNLSLLLDDGPPKKQYGGKDSRREQACKRLEEKVDYAAGLIDCNHRNKWMAVEFLQGLYSRLDGLEKPTEDLLILKDKVRSIIADYGHYHVIKPSKG